MLGPGCLGFHLPAAAWLLPPLTVRVKEQFRGYSSPVYCVSATGHPSSLILKTILPDLFYSPHFTDEETETQNGSEEAET